MTIADHVKSFAGRPVVEAGAEVGGRSPAEVAWRLSLEYDAQETFAQLFERFLSSVEGDQVEALVIGPWAGEIAVGEVRADVPVGVLCAAAASLPNLRSVFLGDITFEEAEISWIPQADVTPLLETFPLERLRVRGSDGLAFRPVSHGTLIELGFESGGLPTAVIHAVSQSDLPRLEHLELWLGTADYGGDATVDDLAPILDGAQFPALSYLGLRDSVIADDVAAALAAAPVVRQLRVLDLSLGTLSDRGVDALLAGQALDHLERLDLHHHYISPEAVDRLERRLGPANVEVDASDRQTEDTYTVDGEDVAERYVSVGE